jgi:MFS family permease
MNIIKKSPLLQNTSFISLIISRTINSFAFQMLTIIVGWQMYALTNSPFYLGLVGLAQFLPMFLLTLVVGYVADHFNRKLIIILSFILEGICIFVLAFLSYKGLISKESILIIMFFIGVANAFQGPPMQSLLPNVVTKELFPKAAAMSASLFQFAVIIGPGFGGFLYSLGSYIVYLIIGILIALSSIFMLFIKVNTEQQIKTGQVNLKSLLLGISFIKKRPVILGAISLDLFAVLFGGATALLPVYASTILFIGPIGLGVLRSAPAVGALLMSALLAKNPMKSKVGKRMFIAVIIFGLATIVFAVSKNLPLSIFALFVLGASDVVSVVIRSTLIQISTPDDMRGRVSSVNLMFIGTSNQLGEFESGLTASLLGTVPSVLIGGIGTILVVLLWMKLFPQLVNIDSMEHGSVSA